MRRKLGREFYRLLGSFLFLLALPLVVFGSLYLRSVANVRESTAEMMEGSLLRDGAVTDSALHEIRRSAGTFVSNDNVRYCSGIVGEPTPEALYQFTHLQDDISALMTSDSGVYDACIWFPRGSCFLSTNARFPRSQREYLASTYYGVSYAELMRQCFSQPTGFHLYERENGSRTLIYVQRMGVQSDAAVLVLRLKNSVLESLRRGAAEVIGEQRMVEVDGVTYTADLAGVAEPEESDIQISRSSAVSGLRWRSAVPRSYVRSETGYILRMTALYLLLYSLVGAGLAYLLARRSYSPIDQIMKSLSLSGDRRSSEYAQIEQRMADMLRRSERAEYALEQSMESVRSGYLRRLLRGRARPEASATYGVDFGGDAWFGVLVFGVRDYGPQFSAAGEIDDRTSEALLYSVQNVADESAGCRSYSFADGEQVVSILSAPTPELPAGEMARVSRSTADFFREKLGVVLEARCSGTVEGPEALPTAWKELAAGGIRLTGETAQAEDSDPLPAENDTDAILDYVAAHCCDGEFGLGSVAEHFGMNPSYLSRKFKSEVGVGFGEYAQSLRFEKAKQLLGTSELSVAQVAAEVGYFSVSAFTAAFRKAIGVSPNTYRNGEV